MSSLPAAMEFGASNIVELSMDEVDTVAGAMTAAQASHAGNIAAGIGAAAMMVPGGQFVAAAALGFSIGCYLGAVALD